MSRISIIIVTYNSQRWIPGLLNSLKALEPQADEVIVVDNASQDQTVELLKKSDLKISLIQNTTNRWFSAGVNQGLALAGGEYIYLWNPDASVRPTGLTHLAGVLDQHAQTAAVIGKMLRGDYVDSFGLSCTRARQFYNRGEGETVSSDYDHQPVFGFSGGSVLLRLKALKDISVRGEILDEEFVAYKDDVDLSYRLRLAGWEIEAIPEIIGEHQRTVFSPADRGDLSRAKNRRGFSAEIRLLSSRNHLWTLMKNEPLSSLLLDSPWIAWYELKKFAYILLADPRSLRAYGQALFGLPRMIRKRRWIQTHRTISPSSLRHLCRS